jgi:Phage integrase, N-terminal SAM-like domain
MTTASSSFLPTAPSKPPFTEAELFALAGFLAGYSGRTFEAYALDLRKWCSWCLSLGVRLFEVRRAHIEAWGRSLEAAGRARSTVARRLCTVVCFYATPNKKASSTTRPRCTSAGRASITSRTPRAWIATSSADCSSPRDSLAPSNTR